MALVIVRGEYLLLLVMDVPPGETDRLRESNEVPQDCEGLSLLGETGEPLCIDAK